jgi:hypothetical protein
MNIVLSPSSIVCIVRYLVQESLFWYFSESQNFSLFKLQVVAILQLFCEMYIFLVSNAEIFLYVTCNSHYLFKKHES